MKKLLFLIIVAATVSGFVNYKSSSRVRIPLKHLAADTVKTWYYQTNIDKMTSKPTYSAMLFSTNKLNFEAPYDGGSTASIDVMNDEHGSDVILGIDNGQFQCDGDGCEVDIRFDSNPAMKFKGEAPSSGSTKLLFISPTKKFITQLKKARKMIIRADFYQSGANDMEFIVDGLKWDH